MLNSKLLVSLLTAVLLPICAQSVTAGEISQPHNQVTKKVNPLRDLVQRFKSAVMSGNLLASVFIGRCVVQNKAPRCVRRTFSAVKILSTINEIFKQK